MRKDYAKLYLGSAWYKQRKLHKDMAGNRTSSPVMRRNARPKNGARKLDMGRPSRWRNRSVIACHFTDGTKRYPSLF